MGTPKRSLSTLDAVAMIVGIVIGAGIFALPSFVASNVAGPGTFIGVWIVGGLISLIGALCYAELAATYPNTGGDYYFLMRAFGPAAAFLFAWARMTVIQTGSIALLAFVIGDYVAAAANGAQEAAGAGHLFSTFSAAVVVIALTAINIAGVHMGKSTQNALTALVLLGILLIVVAGALVWLRSEPVTFQPVETSANAFGMAMVFVLYTYGGWNEAAYLSAEMRGGRRTIVAALVLGIATVTAIYLFVNSAYLAALGFAGVKESGAIAADTLNLAWGKTGGMFITAIVIVAALSTANATVFTGARTNYALGRDFRTFSVLAQWTEDSSTPRNALIVQCLIALALVALGGSQERIETMVAYTAPVFWFFFLLVGVALIVLRYKDPAAERPFRVPFYPWLPVVFCGTCAYMFYAALAYAAKGALLGLAVLASGVPLMFFAIARQPRPASGPPLASAADSTETADD